LERELCASYIGLREEPRGRGEAVAWELAGRPLMAARCGGFGEWKGRAVEWGGGGALMARGGGGRARGSRGGGAGVREPAAGAGKGGRRS
jgi:hypothetical protein